MTQILEFFYIDCPFCGQRIEADSGGKSYADARALWMKHLDKEHLDKVGDSYVLINNIFHNNVKHGWVEYTPPSYQRPSESVYHYN